MAMHKPLCISATCDVRPVLLADRQRRAYVTPPSARRANRRPSKVPRWKITRRAGRSFANGCRFLRTSGRRLIRPLTLQGRQSSRTNFSQVGVTRTKEWWAGYCHGPADDDWRSIFERAIGCNGRAVSFQAIRHLIFAQDASIAMSRDGNVEG
jgi:hypothetical protein